jgi:hypothetical protein
MEDCVMSSTFDRKRLERFVFQECNRNSSSDPLVVMDKLEKLYELFPKGTQLGRQALVRLATALIHSNCQPEIFAPCCPDYSHQDGKYTFQELRGGISLLTSLHIEFLNQLVQILPESPVTILIADQEAENPDLCRVCRKTREEFLELVLSSIRRTQEFVSERGWRVQPFTDYIPDLLAQEEVISQQLLDRPEIARRIRSETIDRQAMYRRIGAFRFEEMMERTARTAAQYIVLGRQVKARQGIIVNHTTTNLGWYAETDVALLHNPVCIY